VTQVSHFLPEKLELHWVQFQVGFSQPLEHLLQVVELLLKRAADDNDVMQVQ
jgi:hypothetical protein